MTYLERYTNGEYEPVWNELHRLEQSLRMAEAEPLAELFCSLIAKSGEEEQTRQYVRSGVEQELRRHGALIQIEFGLFVAWS
jgi:hypothetical protein